MTSPRSRWTPVLVEGHRARAMACVDVIASALAQPELVRPENASLSSGSAGWALFFASLCDAVPEARGRYSDRTLKLLDNSIDALAGPPMSHSLYSGFTGIAWVVERLRRHLPGSGDPNTDIDAALVDFVSQRPWRRDYDVIQGLTGLGIYALDRMTVPAGVDLLENIIGRLSEMAIVQGDGITWHTPASHLPQWQREVYPNGYYNLGLAHGVPGIIALLGRACGAGVAVREARPLLDGAVRWLLSHKNDGESVFGNVVRDDYADDSPPSSRIAWCYGDLGIATALLWAARCVQEESWEREALDIALHTARRSLEHSGVVDAGLCHGAAGNGHLFNRLYQATRKPTFQYAARVWFERTLELYRPGEGMGGYSAWRKSDPASDGTWSPEAGFLEGAAGIGLALIAASTAIEPDWDSMLMVSIPPK